MKSSEIHTRLDTNDYRLLKAMSKHHPKLKSPRKWIHELIERWLNENSEENLQLLYSGGVTLPVPGYSLRWDEEIIPGDRPQWIKINDYMQKESKIEVKAFMDTKTGKIVWEPVKDEYFDEGYDGGKISIDDEEEDDSDPMVYVYRNVKDGSIRKDKGRIREGEEKLKTILNMKTDTLKYVDEDYFVNADEVVVDLFEDEGGIYHNGYDDIPDDELIVLKNGEDVTRKDK